MIEDAKEAENMLVKIRQYRLNHKPFSFHFAINAEKPMKAAIRIFLGPKQDIHHKSLSFAENAKYFYEMDNWIVYCLFLEIYSYLFSLTNLIPSYYA